jgi:hypothetical protein
MITFDRGCSSLFKLGDFALGPNFRLVGTLMNMQSSLFENDYFKCVILFNYATLIKFDDRSITVKNK